MKKNKVLCSKLDLILQEKVEISNERDLLKFKLELALKENDILKNRNDCNNVLKKNEFLTSKLDFVLKENDFLKNNFFLFQKNWI